MLELLQYNNFIKNKYFSIYIQIINKSITEKRNYDKKSHEKHHILPKSLGGSNQKSNIVVLTFKEHFVIHHLLTKFTQNKDKSKMTFAFHCFFHMTTLSHKFNSLTYEHHKKQFKEHCKTRKSGTIKKEKFLFKNKLTNQELYFTRREMFQSGLLTEQEIYNITSKRIRHSKNWSIFLDDKQCFGYELKIIRPSQSKKQCEYCNKNISITNYIRWHGNNCKKISPELHYINTEQIRNLQPSR